MSINPIKNFGLEKSDINFIGHDLDKPTSILATRDNHLLVTDARGGVTRISIASGEQQLITGLVGNSTGAYDNDQPCSMAFVDEQKIMIANVGKGYIEVLDLEERKRNVLYDSIDGIAIGRVNFLLRDSKNRTWVTVSTRRHDLIEAFNPDINDGYIALIENGQIKIVAEGFAFTNEIRLDDAEEYLYIVETAQRRISRMKVHADGRLTNREVYGPADMGPAGFPDGIAFDSYGNLWGTIVCGEKIFAITPEGDWQTIFDDGNPEAIKKIDEAYHQRTLTKEILFAGASKIAPLMTSLTFAGPDLRTVYLGSYGTRLPYFKAPVSGQKPVLPVQVG